MGIQTVGLAQFRYRQALRTALRRVWAHVPGSADWFVGDAIMGAYTCAFTPEAVDPHCNYEFYEILGDASLNKSVTWYFQDRYPQLRCARGVRYLARLKINTVAKDQLSRWTCLLGLAPFVRWEHAEDEKCASDETVSASASAWTTHQMSVLEDVFEAMLGVTELRVDALAGDRGPGYRAVYSLVARLLDPVPFELTYEALWDAKTRLKELFDAHPRWRLKYAATQRGPEASPSGFAVDVSMVRETDTKSRPHSVAIGSSPPGQTFGRRIDAEQAAAERALETLRARPDLLV